MKSIFQIITNVIDQITKEAQEIEDFAKEKGFSVRVSKEYKIVNTIIELFPELNFGNNSIHLVNGINNIVGTINRAKLMLYPNAINSIGFDSFNEKNKTVKLSSVNTYENYLFEKYFFNIEGNNSIYFSPENQIKKYKNGSVVYQLNNEQFTNFLNVVNFTTPQTEQIINAIQGEDKLKYLECSKINHMNEYMVIHDIKDRLNINGLTPLNYNQIFNALKM